MYYHIAIFTLSEKSAYGQYVNISNTSYLCIIVQLSNLLVKILIVKFILNVNDVSIISVDIIYSH